MHHVTGARIVDAYTGLRSNGIHHLAATSKQRPILLDLHEVMKAEFRALLPASDMLL